MSNLRIAVIVSEFNKDITQALHDGALSQLKKHGLKNEDYSIAWVPGAREIPITAQRYAKTGRYDAIIALGSVVRGDTDHYRYVCEQVSQGCLQVELSYDIPVIFEVLMTETEKLALERAGGSEGNRGSDAVDIAISMIERLKDIA